MKLLSRAEPATTNTSSLSPAGKNELNGLLGKGSTFEGKLVFEGTVHLNGTFTGEIHSSDTLIIGEGAKVNGLVVAGTVIINGDVTGEIRASQVIEMHAPSRVRANVMSPQLVVERGVLFEGASRMEPVKASTPAPERVPMAPKPVQRTG